MILWIANRAIAPIQNGDTGLYHMQAVKWAASYPIVPGLGNLHERLAFNSTFFLYAAMLGVGPWVQQSHYLANGLLCFVFMAQLFLSLREIIAGNVKYRSYHIFSILLLGPTFGLMLKPDLSSLTPNIAIFIISIVIVSRTYFLFVSYDELDKNAGEIYFEVFLVITLCTVGITIKLTFFPIAFSTLILLFILLLSGYFNLDTKRIQKALILALSINLPLLGLWAVRGVLLSGYIAFPSTLGSLPVTWRVPRPLALSITNWIRSWARAPGVFWPEVLDNWNWFWPWLKNFPYEYIKALVTVLLGIILYLITIIGITPNCPRRSHTYLAILVPPFISVAFSFYTAPDPGYTGACFWIFGAGLTSLAIDRVGLKGSKTTTIFEYLVCLLFFIYLLPSYSSLVIPPNQKNGPFYNFPTPQYITIPINDLIKLNLPTQIDQCWDIPIPCTPYYRPTLRIRKNSLSSGFLLDETFTFADMHQSSIPKGIIVSQELGVSMMEADWNRFDEAKSVRWIRMPGKILVYTQAATYIKLFLKPFEININGYIRNEEKLMVSVNDSSNTELSLKSGMVTEAVLRLAPDFNIITLDAVAPNARPNETHPGGADTSAMGVAFYSIELRSIAPLR
jgi:hypothetical protein